MKSPAGIGFHGYLIRSRACFRFDDFELPEYRVAKSEETGEGIRAGNAFPSGTAGRKAAVPAAAGARRAGAASAGLASSRGLAASKHNVDVKAAADRPRADGKPRKAVITASPASWS